MFGCCGKGRKAQLEAAAKQAEEAAKRETVTFNFGIQQSLIQKASKSENLDVPPILIGRHPKAMFGTNDGDKVLRGTIHFQCPTATENHFTCDGHGHAIVGSAETSDGTTRMEITKGSWSPAGYCFWIEKTKSKHKQKEEIAFVIHDFAHANDNCQTVTTFDAHGNKTRTSRTFQLLLDQDEEQSHPPQPLCPSVRAAVDLLAATQCN